MKGDKSDFDPRPIGIFDSGVGGLTVLGALARQLPGESFIYLGDTARVPYGSKSPRTVERYTLQVADFLLSQNVKALVVACNTASALGLAALRTHCDVPIQGVIQPGCRAALSASKSRHIGVIGTRTTMASGAYPHTLYLLNPKVQVSSLACPLFVPLVEENWLTHPATHLIVEESLKPFIHKKLDTLILGCTHYPPLKPVIKEVLGSEVRLVDSAQAVAEEMELRLRDLIKPTRPGTPQLLNYLVTDVAERFIEVAPRFLDGLPVKNVEMVDL
ncbi:MAG: glutamate racemase [Magnetococcales bacterium]|nr:glutamate racemase [Magnetococcales bacterium]